MPKSAHEMLESSEFKGLISRRWSLSIALTAVLFVLYYGFILLIGYNKQLLATKVGEVTTLGIPIGVLVIVLSWLLTWFYVRWANQHDPDFENLKNQVTK